MVSGKDLPAAQRAKEQALTGQEKEEKNVPHSAGTGTADSLLRKGRAP